MFLVRCPNCKQTMKVAPRIEVKKAVKKCVYCGKSFRIHLNVKDTNIVKRL